jgi:hypothetical protein
MNYLFQDGGKPKKAKTTKSKTKTKTPKKGGNFLGTVGDLVAPTGWGPFATAAGLLALDRADAALRRGKSTKSSAKKMSGGGGTGPPPIPKNPGNNGYETFHFGVPSQTLPRFTPKPKPINRINNRGFSEVIRRNENIMANEKYMIDYIDKLNKYINVIDLIKNMPSNYQSGWNNYYINLLINLDSYLSSIIDIEILKKALKKLKKYVDLSKLIGGNPDLTELPYIGKYFKNPFEWVLLSANGKPVVKQRLYLNLNK